MDIRNFWEGLGKGARMGLVAGTVAIVGATAAMGWWALRTDYQVLFGELAPQDAAAFVALCRDELKLPVKGLMCIPPNAENPAPHFALLQKLARETGLPLLSMGMSGDFESAIKFGATHVRVGSAIFGERSVHKG